MSGEQKHLTIEQIERLLEIHPAEAVHSDDADSLEQSRQHLACCETCKQLVSMQGDFAKDLSNLKFVRETQSSKDCPREKEIVELAAGILQPTRSKELLDHVTSCDFCGPILRRAVEDFDEHISSEESTLLAGLQSGNKSWQGNLAARLTGTTSSSASSQSPRPISGGVSTNFLGWSRWLLAGTAVILVAISSWWLLRDRELRHVNSLIAQAYTERRTIELRLPGAAYAPLRIARGIGQSRLDAPRTLLEAESRIASKRGKTKQAVDWLIVGAQADILEWNYDAAIHTLREAEALAPQISMVRIDLATAYFERAQATGYVSDFGTAVELISRVLEKDPNNVVALFNRALIYEKLSLYSEAEADWQHYLSLEPSGDWSGEAREHLARVDQKLNEKKKAADAGDLVSPEIIAANSTMTISDDLLDMRIEEYQRTVLTEWAPEFVKSDLESKPGRTVFLRNAIERISRLMTGRHGDTFLQDLLFTSRGSAGPRFQLSIATLALAISANASGHEQEATELSQEAERGFHDTGNKAGVLRARFEYAYAQQFSSQVIRCQRIAESVAKDSRKYRYKWLEAQALVEWGFCANMDGSLTIASHRLREATTVAKEAGYEESLERAMVGEAVMQWQTGSTSLAWSLALEGLQRYWVHPVSDVRGTSLYAVLDLIAEETQQWHLQEAILRESIPLVDRGRDQLAAAQTRSRLAGSELMLNQYRQAESDLQQSSQIFRSAPQTVSTLTQQVTVSVNMAKVEMQRHQFQRSWERLQSLQSVIASLHDNLSLLDFYATLGEVCRNTGRTIDAESADRNAIAIFQASLGALDDPGDRLVWFHEGSLAYRSLVQLKLNEEDFQGAFETWEAYRDVISTPPHQGNVLAPEVAGERSHFAQNSSRTYLGPDASRSQPLGSREKLLAYARLPEGMFGWIRSSHAVQVIRIDNSLDDIRRLRTLFIQECSTPSSDIADIIDHGQQLYRKLILPFSKQFSADDIIVFEPDEELASLPFEALVDETGQYFGSKHSVIISMGSGKDSRSQLVRRVSNHDTVLLVSASGSDGENRLHDPLAEEEVRSIGSLFQSPLIFSPTAFPGVSFRELLSTASIFHYAGHSRTTVRGGELSIPSRDRYGRFEEVSLRSKDIVRLDLYNCELVILSACETNQGEEGRWLDRENLALAFLNTGVPEVVASHWQVDSNAATVMMEEFYSRLFKGETSPDALRLAAAKTRAMAGFSHPYYWAAFSVLARI